MSPGDESITPRNSSDWKLCFLNQVDFQDTAALEPLSLSQSLALNSVQESWWPCVARNSISSLCDRYLPMGTAATGSLTDITCASELI